MSIGENLQFYRAREGLTQEELAERLEVSRQSVSKWESNTSFPEMEKLMTLCSLFQTDLDTLVRGDAQAACQEDTVGYDRHMNAFSNAVAIGVGLILLGVAAALSLYGLAGIPDTWCGAVILSAIAVAVAILVVAFIKSRPLCPAASHPAPDLYPRPAGGLRPPLSLPHSPAHCRYYHRCGVADASLLLGRGGRRPPGGRLGLCLPAGPCPVCLGAGMGRHAHGEV